MMAVLPADRDPAEIAISGGAAAVEEVLAKKTSLVGFELRQALDHADIGTGDGRIRAFEKVRQIMAETSSVKEREEEMAYVADRLRLSEDSAKLLLNEAPAAPTKRGFTGRGAANSSGAGRAADSRPLLAGRLLKTESSVERDFLVAAVCNPEQAVPLLGSLTPEHFVDKSNREVFVALVDIFRAMQEADDRAGAVSRLRSYAHGESEAGRLFVRLVVEADQGRYSAAVLEELNLRVQEQRLIREIQQRQSQLEDGEDVGENQRHVFHLQRLLKEVQANLANLDPEEGRT
jgi:DNA primase